VLGIFVTPTARQLQLRFATTSRYSALARAGCPVPADRYPKGPDVVTLEPETLNRGPPALAAGEGRHECRRRVRRLKA